MMASQSDHTTDYGTMLSLLLEAVYECAKEHFISHIALVFPNQGPLGVVQFRAALCLRLAATDIRTVVVRINERLLRKQVNIDFEDPETPKMPLGPGDNVLIFSDAMTTGASIQRAANIVRKFGATCTHAFAIYDRQEISEEEDATDTIPKNAPESVIDCEDFISRTFLISMGSLPEDRNGGTTEDA